MYKYKITLEYYGWDSYYVLTHIKSQKWRRLKCNSSNSVTARMCDADDNTVDNVDIQIKHFYQPGSFGDH